MLINDWTELGFEELVIIYWPHSWLKLVVKSLQTCCEDPFQWWGMTVTANGGSICNAELNRWVTFPQNSRFRTAIQVLDTKAGTWGKRGYPIPWFLSTRRIFKLSQCRDLSAAFCLHRPSECTFFQVVLSKAVRANLKLLNWLEAHSPSNLHIKRGAYSVKTQSNTV